MLVAGSGRHVLTEVREESPVRLPCGLLHPVCGVCQPAGVPEAGCPRASAGRLDGSPQTAVFSRGAFCSDFDNMQAAPGWPG